MNDLRNLIGFSFKQLEQTLWGIMLEEFSKGLVEVLSVIDELLFKQRDTKRFESKGFVSRSMGTMLGRDVCFRRRRYRDRQTGKEVFLLDEVLEIGAHTQLSPGLMALMLTQSVTTNSYRKAAESICRFLGFQAVSHETIRQLVLHMGDELETLAAEERRNPQGDKKVPVLFIEADGMWVPLQKLSKKRIEEKLFTSHEGWEPRYAGSQQHRLKEVRQFRTHCRGDVWEETSRWVYSRYDIDEDTVVVINGDRAEWIRRGVEYFPNAMYQVDRFHLSRDLKRLFGVKSKAYRQLMDALDSDDPTGASFLAELAAAVPRITDETKRAEARSMLKDLLSMPEAVVDYRVRLKALGVSVEGLHGMGAAESQVDRFSDRIKGGRSWRPTGLGAMMELQRTRHEGIFGDIVERIEEWSKAGGDMLEDAKETVRKAARAVVAAATDTLRAGVPIKLVGKSASGGLSYLFHRLNESGMPSAT